MAKRAGSEDKGPAPSAPKEHNLGPMTPETYLAAVKEITAEKARLKAAGAKYKQLRKDWGARGIKLTVLDAMVTMADWDRAEIRDHFEVQAKYAEWLGLPVAKQADLFRGKSDDAIQAHEWYMTGRTYSRTGKTGRPPEECPEDFHQSFMRGFNEEDELAWADGAGDEPIEAKGDEAAGDPDLKLDPTYGAPPWSNFSDDTEEWFADQKAAFAAWFESLPADAAPTITHPGVRDAFEKAVAEEIAARGNEDGVPRLAEEGEVQEAVGEIVDPDPLGVGEEAPADGVAGAKPKGKGKGKATLSVVH